jgi:hypothetical protein
MFKELETTVARLELSLPASRLDRAPDDHA